MKQKILGFIVISAVGALIVSGIHTWLGITDDYGEKLVGVVRVLWGMSLGAFLMSPPRR